MNSTTSADETRQLILALRSDLEVLRATHTATSAVLQAVLATHTEPHHCKTAVEHMERQLQQQAQALPAQSREIMTRTIEAFRTTLDRNQQNRDAHKAKAAH